MAKRILAILGIVLASAVLFVVGCAVILFLAPGVEIFGIRYVAVGQGNNYYRDYADGFSGDIYISSIEVPVIISYQWGISTPEIEYKQEFIGFTRSERRDNQLVQGVENNNLYITAYDTEEFIYSHESVSEESEFLKVRIPQTYVNRKVFVEADSSNVTIEAGGSGIQSEIKIDTTGEISINGTLNVGVLDISTKRSLVLGNNVHADTLNLKGGSYTVNIDGAIASVMNVEMGSGSVVMTQANILNFKSTSGSIKAKDGSKLTIAQGNIETYSGNISVDRFTGSELSTIKTTVGNVTIGEAEKINVENLRSSTMINKVASGNITGGIGVISVLEATSSLSATTQSGYVYLGEADKSVKNPTIQTKTGKIVAENVSGNVNLISKNNSVTMKGTNVLSVNIESGGSVLATGVQGETQISGDGEIDVTVVALTGNVNIEAGDGCKKVTLNMRDVSIDTFNYEFTSSKSRNAFVYAGDAKLFEESSIIKSETVNSFLKALTITTSYADMYVYTK